jgi:hypothetical protein
METGRRGSERSGGRRSGGSGRLCTADGMAEGAHVTTPNLSQIRSARYVFHHNPRIIVVIHIT